MQSTITELDTPNKIAITLGTTGGVSFELKPEGNDVLLTMIHRSVPDRGTLLNVSAGWHMHLDILAACIAGTAPAAGTFWDGWSRLKAEYDERLPA